MRRWMPVAAMLLMAGLLTSGPGSVIHPSSCIVGEAYAQDWRAEFDDICRKTNEAVSLSKDELRQLISRCEKLRTIIGTLDETEKKVFMKRLSLCQDLFVFVLDSKEKQ